MCGWIPPCVPAAVCVPFRDLVSMSAPQGGFAPLFSFYLGDIQSGLPGEACFTLRRDIVEKAVQKFWPVFVIFTVAVFLMGFVRLFLRHREHIVKGVAAGTEVRP